LPSGLQAGERSATPLVWVRARGLPFSAGRDQRSPRAPTAARLPEGEMLQSWMKFESSTWRVRMVGRSPGMVMVTWVAFSVPRSRRKRPEPYW